MICLVGQRAFSLAGICPASAAGSRSAFGWFWSRQVWLTTSAFETSTSDSEADSGLCSAIVSERHFAAGRLALGERQVRNNTGHTRDG